MCQNCVKLEVLDVNYINLFDNIFYYLVFTLDKIKFRIAGLLFIKIKFTNLNHLNHLTNISMNWLPWLQIIIMLFRLIFCFIGV